MAVKEIEKNSRDIIQVEARTYHDHDLIDIRTFVWKTKDRKERIPTRQGISVNGA